MITLHAFGPLWGVPDPSPFVIKTEVQLKMAGLPYRRERGGPQGAPKGKLPFIVDDGETVADSTFIRDHIERKYGLDLDAGLTPQQRSQAWMIERMLEDHIYWAIVHARWGDDANFEKGPRVFFEGAPDEVREAARQRVIQNLHGQGFGRHGFDEVGDLARRSFAALSTQLGEGPFLFGETMSGVDATAFGMVAAALVPRFDAPMRTAAEGFPNLMAYRDRLMTRFYPELAAEASRDPIPSADSTRLTHA
jgi:glutathione S-transferase